MSIFDADDLIRLAGRIEDQADALRARSRALTSAAGQARWHSTAADTFRGEVGRLDRRVHHVAHNLDRAAHELRAHAGRVRAVQSALAAAARVERAALAEAGHVAGAAARMTMRAGAGVVHAGAGVVHAGAGVVHAGAGVVHAGAGAVHGVGHAGRWFEDTL